MNRTNPDRLPTSTEAHNLAHAFERGRDEVPDPAMKLRYALARNVMKAFALRQLERPTRSEPEPNLVGTADELFRRLAAGELKAKDAVAHWEQCRRLSAGLGPEGGAS